MLMFEIWSLGEMPFPHLSPTEVNVYQIHSEYDIGIVIIVHL